jgi:hypothetical protein
MAAPIESVYSVQADYIFGRYHELVPEREAKTPKKGATWLWKRALAKGHLSPNPFFLPDYYLARYKEVREWCDGKRHRAYAHWSRYGVIEGRQGSPLFDPKYYVYKNAGKLPEGIDGRRRDYGPVWNHFLTEGYKLPLEFSGDEFEIVQAECAACVKAITWSAMAAGVGGAVEGALTGGSAGGLVGLMKGVVVGTIAGVAMCAMDITSASAAGNSEFRERGHFTRDLDRQNAAGERMESRERSGRLYA